MSRPEIYEAADERGLLLWQDFPLQWGYARGIRKQAGRQAEAMVDLLGHHPSVAIWCGHNEPLALDGMPSPGKFFALQELPTWNKTVLDSTVKRAIERADGTRPVIAHSGVLPHPGSGGTDTHIYFGWYHGEERDFPGFCAAVPRMARFVTEFGAQAVPVVDGFMEPERWPDLDWERLGPHALAPARTVRPLRAAGRLRLVRRVARRDPGLPSRRHPLSHRDVAAVEVPAHRWVLPVRLRRRASVGHVVGARPRAGAEGGLRRAGAPRARR